VAISKLGAYPVYINKTDTQLSRGESIEETAKMFSLYLDALVYRTSNQKNIEDFAEFSDIPVINALSDSEHPTQIISDIFTIKEMKPERDISDLKIVYIGDGNNIANSLSLIADTLDLNLTVCTPKGYEPSSRTYCTSNLIEAVQDADVVYTDVWTSMGDEGEEKKRMKDFEDFQINPALTKLSKKDYIFMHCLPAHIGEEVTKEVIESPNSAVYSQAENKQYTAMAIIDLFL
jgi:ornithine carbamoyltransferase